MQFFASLMRSFSSLHFSCRRGSVTLRKIYGFFESTMNVPFNFIVRCIFQNDFFFSLCTSGKTKCIFCKIVFFFLCCDVSIRIQIWLSDCLEDSFSFIFILREWVKKRKTLLTIFFLFWEKEGEWETCWV